MNALLVSLLKVSMLGRNLSRLICFWLIMFFLSHEKGLLNGCKLELCSIYLHMQHENTKEARTTRSMMEGNSIMCQRVSSLFDHKYEFGGGGCGWRKWYWYVIAFRKYTIITILGGMWIVEDRCYSLRKKIKMELLIEKKRSMKPQIFVPKKYM